MKLMLVVVAVVVAVALCALALRRGSSGGYRRRLHDRHPHDPSHDSAAPMMGFPWITGVESGASHGHHAHAPADCHVAHSDGGAGCGDGGGVDGGGGSN